MLRRAVQRLSGQGRLAYLDMQSTTPVDPRVMDAMLPFLSQRYGNPHSRSHAFGWDAEEQVEKARIHLPPLSPFLNPNYGPERAQFGFYGRKILMSLPPQIVQMR